MNSNNDSAVTGGIWLTFLQERDQKEEKQKKEQRLNQRKFRTFFQPEENKDDPQSNFLSFKGYKKPRVGKQYQCTRFPKLINTELSSWGYDYSSREAKLLQATLVNEPTMDEIESSEVKSCSTHTRDDLNRYVKLRQKRSKTSETSKDVIFTKI